MSTRSYLNQTAMNRPGSRASAAGGIGGGSKHIPTISSYVSFAPNDSRSSGRISSARSSSVRSLSSGSRAGSRQSTYLTSHHTRTTPTTSTSRESTSTHITTTAPFHVVTSGRATPLQGRTTTIIEPLGHPKSTSASSSPSYTLLKRHDTVNGTTSPERAKVEYSFGNTHQDSQETRLRHVFDELAVPGSRSFGFDQFSRLLRTLRINLATDVLSEMYYRHLDGQGRGCVTYTEYLNWAQEFPTLVEAIYSRSMAVVERIRQDQVLKDAQTRFEEAQQVERAAQEDVDQMTAAVEERRREVVAQEQYKESLNLDKNTHNHDVLQLMSAADQARSAVNTEELKATNLRVQLKDAKEIIQKAERECQRQEQEVEGTQNRSKSLDEEERMLQAKLAEVRRENGLVQEHLCDLQGDLAVACQRRDEGHTAAQDCSHRAREQEAELNEAQRNLAQAQETLEQGKDEQEEAHRAITTASTNLEALHTTLQTDLLELRQRQHQHQHAVAKLEEAEGVVTQVEETLCDFHAKKIEKEVAEAPLIDEEFNLRQQRKELQQATAILNEDRQHMNKYMK